MTITSPPAARAGSYRVGDLELNRIGYGAMQLAGPGVFGPPRDRAAAIEVLRTAVELGVNHIDTADAYGPYITNEIIREALFPYDDQVHIVTKVGAVRDERGGWLPANSPESLRAQVHDNLRRLGLDVLEVVNLRTLAGIDDRATVADTLTPQFEALAELRGQGLIRHLGLSTVGLDQLAEAQHIAPVVCVQNFYNIANRADDAVLAATAEQHIASRAVLPARRLLAAAVGRAGVGRQAARRDPDGRRLVLAATALAEPDADPGHFVGRSPAREHRRRGDGPAARRGSRTGRGLSSGRRHESTRSSP
jgi:aryl-alcohol dehydrogenase-like predicted oxidoreductase